MQNAIIHSNGMYVPERVVSNKYFDELLGENVSDWLEEFVEIYERRWAAEDESTADLAAAAARQAMERGEVKPEEVDLLIISTDTPEFISPSTSSKVQHMLGLKNAGTFDINTACAGFVTGLDIGAKYIRADAQYQTVLVVGAYAMSKFINKLDKKTANLFADGAGAFVLKAEQNSNRGMKASRLITHGQYHDYMGIFAGGTNQPITPETLENGDHLLKIDKKFPPEINPDTWSAIARDLSEKTGTPLEHYTQFFLTQININSIRETMERLGLPAEKAQTSMHYYGYTGSACIPLAFEDALQAGKIKRGDSLMFIGSGGGLAFAGASFIY